MKRYTKSVNIRFEPYIEQQVRLLKRFEMYKRKLVKSMLLDTL